MDINWKDSEEFTNNDDGVTSTNDCIMRGEDTDIRTISDSKRKAESGDENPEEGKKQINDDQKQYEWVL